MMWWRQAGFLWRLNDDILFPFDNSEFDDDELPIAINYSDAQLEEETSYYDYDYDYEYV